MAENEIISAVLTELTENALKISREKFSEDKQNSTTELSRKVKGILAELPAEDAEIIEDYTTKTMLEAQEDCKLIYIQGAKDCVKMLKYLEVI